MLKLQASATGLDCFLLDNVMFTARHNYSGSIDKEF